MVIICFFYDTYPELYFKMSIPGLLEGRVTTLVYTLPVRWSSDSPNQGGVCKSRRDLLIINFLLTIFRRNKSFIFQNVSNFQEKYNIGVNFTQGCYP